MSSKVLALALLICISAPCYSQSDSSALIEQLIEYIAENISDDQDYSELTERLTFYQKYPLDINKAKKEQLLELVFVTPIQIDKLIQHREESGMFIDLLELQSIDGFDKETIQWLTSFVILKSGVLFADLSMDKLVRKGEHDLMIRFGKVIQLQKGFIASDSTKAIYSGSADRIFTRYRFNYANKLYLSFNLEKDAGEKMFLEKGRGFDFNSGNMFLKGNRSIKKFVVGDYALQFGQGLAMWSGLGFGKGAGFTTVAKYGAGLQPYSSVNESSFLRGTSATVEHGNLLLTPFISYKQLDASLSDDKSEINSLSVSGLHRTATEINNKNTVSQLVYGANAEYRVKGLRVGITGYKTDLDKPVSSGNLLYERYDFAGRELTTLGLHYAFTYKNTYVFGEGAYSISYGKAFLNGLMTSLSNRVSGVVLYRQYERNFHSFFNRGLSESTKAKNEQGLLAGLNILLNDRTELTTYFDIFSFPWLKFRVDAPSRGYELFTQLAYNFNKKFKISGRFKQQQKEENASEASLFNGLEHVERQNFRLEFSYKLSNSFSLRNRVEISSYKKGTVTREYGFMSYQDVIFKPMGSSFSGNLRFAIFDTQGYDTRIYAYENDVLYSYSVPSYQGNGLRCYLNGRYTFKRVLDIWLRYALFSYIDQKTIGSGYDIIAGDKKSDVKLQMRFRF